MWYVAGMAKLFAAGRWIYVRVSYKKAAVLAVIITAVEPGELNEVSYCALVNLQQEIFPAVMVSYLRRLLFYIS
jgi:hypothetical protein